MIDTNQSPHRSLQQEAEQSAHDDSGAPASLLDAAAALQQELISIAALVPATLVREQLADPVPGRITGAYWHGSVLFADLSGFTAISERLSALGKQGAEEISAVVNRLFAALVEEVHRFGGTPLKFGGDALTAFFDTTLVGESHAALASTAALAMQRRMAAFAAVPTPVGQFSLQLRVGVHSGPVFAAQVGDLDHIELLVSGRTVNQVAIAQEVAAPGEVVVSATTLALLPPSSLRFTERGKGFGTLDEMPALAPPASLPLLIPPLPPQPDQMTLERLRAQIAALRPYLMHSLPSRYVEGKTAVELGEFRPVTIMFAHVSSFSSILESLGDATDLAATLFNAYYRRAQAIIHSYGGVINKVDMAPSGDKLMALFGAPLAHEDDPSRAVRCALELGQALEEANKEIAERIARTEWSLDNQGQTPALHSAFSLYQSIGINTGTVFAGRVGPSERHEYSVMGPSVNLAARLMSAAEAGTVILSPSTRRAVEREIAVVALPPITLKGLAEPVTPALALRARSGGRSERSTADNGLRRAPLVAREEELGQSLQHSRAALNGAGGVLTLVGAAGIGKTRVLQELLQQLVLDSHSGERTVQSFAIYLGDCQSYEQSTPYSAVRGLLHYLLNVDIATNDNTQIGVQAKQQVQRFVPELARFAPLLGDLLGTPLPETPLTAQLTPEQRHDRAHDLVEALLRSRMRDEGLLLVIEDLHWADPSSLELLARLSRVAREVRLLLVFSYRPGQQIAEPWLELPNTLRLELHELSPAGSQTLARALLDAPPPPELTALLDRTQGNPFFIEEMLRDLVATATLVRSTTGNAAGAWQLARPLDSLVLPDSIEGVLTAQLDRLAERSRDLVQVAAVIGRRFLYLILRGMYSPKSTLDNGLEQLTASDIVLAEELGRDLAYLFRHALVRDVAYEGILYAHRRSLHQRVAERIIGLYGPEAPDQVPLLARHYLLAEVWPQAFHYHWLAGRAAQQRYANREALALFDQALAIAPHLHPRQTEREVEILEQSGSIALLVGQYDRALTSFEQALTLVDTLPSATSEQIVRLHRQIAATHERRADFDAAFDWLDRAMNRADTSAHNERARCYLLRAGLLQRQGKFQECLTWAMRGLWLADSLGSASDQAKGYKLLGGTYCSLGDLDRAIEPTQQCLQFYADVGDLQEQAGAHINLGNILYDLGRWAEARGEYEAAVRLTTEIGNSYEQALAANNLGEVLRSQGDAEGAIAQYRQALAGWRHSPFHSALVAMNLGATFIQQGDLEEAREQLDRSTTLFYQAGVDSFLPELLRYQAELALAQGDLSSARSYCEESIEQAKQQDALLEEARSQRILGQILLQGGKIDAAASVLHTSLASLQSLKTPFDIARTQVWLADLLFHQGQDNKGRTLLGEALTVLEALGAQYDITQARGIAARHARLP